MEVGVVSVVLGALKKTNCDAQPSYMMVHLPSRRWRI